MKIEVVRNNKGAVEIIELDKKIKRFIYKGSHNKVLSNCASNYGWDGTKKGSKKKEKISL